MSFGLSLTLSPIVQFAHNFDLFHSQLQIRDVTLLYLWIINEALNSLPQTKLHHLDGPLTQLLICLHVIIHLRLNHVLSHLLAYRALQEWQLRVRDQSEVHEAFL